MSAPAQISSEIAPVKDPLPSKPHPRSSAWWQLLLFFSLDNESSLQKPLTVPTSGIPCPGSCLTHPASSPWHRTTTPPCRGEEITEVGGWMFPQEHRRKVVSSFIRKCAEPLSGSSRYILSYTALLAVLGLAKDNECNLSWKITKGKSFF